MLQAKFGDRYGDVPALWFWTRFNREKGGKKERRATSAEAIGASRRALRRNHRGQGRAACG